jgi:hypothetical protein
LTPFAWLLGFILPACGANGIDGLPAPRLMDMTHIERPTTPNTFLAGPAGMRPEPDAIIRARPTPASLLYEMAHRVFSGEPHTYIAAEFPDHLQVHYVVRSALLNFPDLVSVQINAEGPDTSTLVIWSRSVYGRSDFGVNRARVETWLAALQQTSQR